MLYLDYLLYIVIIIFLIVLINKVLDKKEGFVHKGEGVVYTPKEYSSVIKSAVYGTFINGPKDCIDVKPILDKLKIQYQQDTQKLLTLITNTY